MWKIIAIRVYTKILSNMMFYYSLSSDIFCVGEKDVVSMFYWDVELWSNLQFCSAEFYNLRRSCLFLLVSRLEMYFVFTLKFISEFRSYYLVVILVILPQYYLVINQSIFNGREIVFVQTHEGAEKQLKRSLFLSIFKLFKVV